VWCAVRRVILLAVRIFQETQRRLQAVGDLTVQSPKGSGLSDEQWNRMLQRSDEADKACELAPGSSCLSRGTAAQLRRRSLAVILHRCRSFVGWLVGLTCLHQSNRPTRRLGDRVSWTYVPCNVGMGGRPRLAFRRFFRLLVHKHKFVKSNERCQDPTITQRRPKTPKTNLSAGGRVFSRVCD